MNDLVRLEGVGHRYDATTVLSGIDLRIVPDSYTVLLGPSGSGKTTLLSILGGFLVPSYGRVVIDGTEVTALPPARRPTATVFQDYALFPHMSVASNVGFGLRMRRVGRAQRSRRVGEVLELVGLGDRGEYRPHELSGGQRQRVALARALVIEPRVLLLDEPLGALDLALRRQMQDELKATQRRVGTAFVHVTHDQEEAMALADQVVLMNAGRIEDAGAPERVYSRPASRFTATFMGESTVLDGRVARRAGGAVLVETALGQLRVTGEAEPGEHVSIGLRPENLAPAARARDDVAIAEARIVERTFQGSFVRLRVATASGTELLLKCAPGEPLSPGGTIPVYVNPEDLVLLRR